MLAYDDVRTGFRPFIRRARAARATSPAMLMAEMGEPAAYPTIRIPAEGMVAPAALPVAAFAPSGDARLLRRLRHVVVGEHRVVSFWLAARGSGPAGWRCC